MEALENAIRKLVIHAGIEPPHEFNLHQASPGGRKFFILEAKWPAGAAILTAIKRAAPGLPLLTYPGYVTLLPEVAQEIICAAHRLEI